jgi:hypothetical protein
MDVSLYTGNGGTQSITLPGGFSPDFVWVKARSNTQDHYLFDAIRGGSGILRSNTTGAESTGTSYLSFDSTGFSSLNGLSSSGYTYAAWTWDAGTTTVSNSVGSITSSVRANASAGFSVVTYNHGSGVGASTIGHGLGVAPSLILNKFRDGSTNWDVYVRALGPGGRLILNSTNAFTSETDPWNNTNPTSTVFSVGPSSWKGVGNHVAYCFAPVVGYSNFGSYVGNGSSDGSFVYTGFRPRWILIKASSFTQGWALFDTARSTYNASSMVFLQPNTSNSEFTTDIDILSNGFKARANDGNMNGSGQTYIYAAFAESPFQYARAR